jgi:hypothetical protein
MDQTVGWAEQRGAQHLGLEGYTKRQLRDGGTNAGMDGRGECQNECDTPSDGLRQRPYDVVTRYDRDPMGKLAVKSAGNTIR